VGEPPLTGLRILAVEQYGAGPFATMLLADLGAEVIKVERPGNGDVGRHVPPYLGTDDSIYFQCLNRSKKSVMLDLDVEEHRSAFDRLVTKCDAVFNNLRGDMPARLGIDYAALGDVKPSIVCAHLTGFGREGPRATEPGYDYLMQGYAGWMSITGDPDAPPTKSGLSLVDLSAGVAAGLGLVSAVLSARETGVGRDIDVSLFDTAFSMLTYVGAWHLSRGYEPKRHANSSHPSQVPSQILPSKDGWLVVMCAKEKFYRNLVTLMGQPELASDPRFVDFSARLQNREELNEILKNLSLQRTTAEWMEVLRNEVPCAPVNSVEEALEDPQVVDSGMILEIPHEELGPVRQLNSMVRYSNAEPVPPVRGPRLGEHTEQVLSEIAQLDEDEFSLVAQSATRPAHTDHRGAADV